MVDLFYDEDFLNAYNKWKENKANKDKIINAKKMEQFLTTVDNVKKYLSENHKGFLNFKVSMFELNGSFSSLTAIFDAVKVIPPSLLQELILGCPYISACVDTKNRIMLTIEYKDLCDVVE